MAFRMAGESKADQAYHFVTEDHFDAGLLNMDMVPIWYKDKKEDQAELLVCRAYTRWG